MNASVTFEIHGKPFAKQRPKFARRGKFVSAYTPKATVSFEQTVQAIGIQHFPEPLEGPVSLSVVAIFKPAKSWSQKRRAEALGQWHTQKPDYDNIEKAVCDGLNRVAYSDDSQIASATCLKVWGETEKTIVTVAPLQPRAHSIATTPLFGKEASDGPRAAK